jgi:hypothetical protein
MARVSILPFSQLTITKFLLSYLKMIVGFGSLLHRLYGTSGQVKPKGMVSLVLLMHPILLQHWERWTVWLLMCLMPFLLLELSEGLWLTNNMQVNMLEIGQSNCGRAHGSTWKNRIDFEALERARVTSYVSVWEILYSCVLFTSTKLIEWCANFLPSQPQKKMKVQKTSVLHKWSL